VNATSAYNDRVISAFHAGTGVVGGELNRQPLLVPHHSGARSGNQRLTPLLYWQVTDKSVAVLASNYGAHTIRPGSTTCGQSTAMRRSNTQPGRSTRAWRLTTSAPSFSTARSRRARGSPPPLGRTSREIPVVVLDLTMRGRPRRPWRRVNQTSTSTQGRVR
jgi:hypothetical protein